MTGHIAGIPIEETLPWLAPVSGFGLLGIAVMLRDEAERVRRSLGRRPRALLRRHSAGTGKAGR